MAVIELSVRSWWLRFAGRIAAQPRCAGNGRRLLRPPARSRMSMVLTIVRLHCRDVGIDQGEVLADPVAGGVALQRFEDVLVFAEEPFVDPPQVFGDLVPGRGGSCGRPSRRRACGTGSRA